MTSAYRVDITETSSAQFLLWILKLGQFGGKFLLKYPTIFEGNFLYLNGQNNLRIRLSVLKVDYHKNEKNVNFGLKLYFFDSK